MPTRDHRLNVCTVGCQPFFFVRNFEQFVNRVGIGDVLVDFGYEDGIELEDLSLHCSFGQMTLS